MAERGTGRYKRPTALDRLLVGCNPLTLAGWTVAEAFQVDENAIAAPGFGVFEAIYEICSVVDATRLLGMILVGISALVVTDPVEAAMCLRTLEEDYLALGMRSAAHPRRYGHIEKIIGRTLVALMASLPDARREAFLMWQDAAIEEWASGVFSECKFEDEVETMRQVSVWIAGSSGVS